MTATVLVTKSRNKTDGALVRKPRPRGASRVSVVGAGSRGPEDNGPSETDGALGLEAEGETDGAGREGLLGNEEVRGVVVKDGPGDGGPESAGSEETGWVDVVRGEVKEGRGFCGSRRAGWAKVGKEGFSGASGGSFCERESWACEDNECGAGLRREVLEEFEGGDGGASSDTAGESK